MRVLLDTQVWLWMLAVPERIGVDAQALIRAPGTNLLLSAASTWEIAIKTGLDKLELPGPVEEVVPQMIEETGVTPVPVLIHHTLGVSALPPHHRDPFDRLLVAQAQSEGVPIMTADRAISMYEVEVVPAGE